MLFEDTYKTIVKNSSGIYKEKGSKFIALAFPVENEETVKQILDNLRKEYYDARHHCYAYILGADKSAWRINDDGEPGGTAGKPIHGQLLSFDLTNILIVVIRYFGGTKLGVSGLINAYKTAARAAISQTEIVERTVNEIYKIEFPFETMNDVMRIIKEENLHIIDNQFNNVCTITYSIRKNEADRIKLRFRKTHESNITYLKTT
ncbi:MAG: YigZ family protein [Lentimicrobium sp.]|nr:YigZ family protein [Lentimicrobium sp.]